MEKRAVKSPTSLLAIVALYFYFSNFKDRESEANPTEFLLCSSIPMASPLDITEEQARNIIENEAESKGWVPPDLRLSEDTDTVKIRTLLRTLRRTRESIGNAVDASV